MITFLNKDHTQSMQATDASCIYYDDKKAIILLNNLYQSKDEINKINEGWIKNIQIGLDRDYSVADYSISDRETISGLTDSQMIISFDFNE